MYIGGNFFFNGVVLLRWLWKGAAVSRASTALMGTFMRRAELRTIKRKGIAAADIRQSRSTGCQFRLLG